MFVVLDENKGMLDLNKKKFKKNSNIKWFCNAMLKNYHLKIIILTIIQLVLVLEMLII